MKTLFQLVKVLPGAFGVSVGFVDYVVELVISQQRRDLATCWPEWQEQRRCYRVQRGDHTWCFVVQFYCRQEANQIRL